ncbi:MAG: SoxR reducing system RseC family protein [Bacteroidales bacterium]|nr:SoxR reducing system RseC family protein [Bacteroidales bacterium]
MRKEEVRHIGKVVSVTPKETLVEIVSHSACSACHAAGLCGLSEYTEKAVQVPTDPFSAPQVGDEVEVVLSSSMGMKAVWIAYFVPLLVLLAVTLGLIALGVGEAVSGLCGIGAVALYYLGVWFLRDRLRTEYVFTIRKQ